MYLLNTMIIKWQTQKFWGSFFQPSSMFLLGVFGKFFPAILGDFLEALWRRYWLIFLRIEGASIKERSLMAYCKGYQQDSLEWKCGAQGVSLIMFSCYLYSFLFIVFSTSFTWGTKPSRVVGHWWTLRCDFCIWLRMSAIIWVHFDCDSIVCLNAMIFLCKSSISCLKHA